MRAMAGGIRCAIELSSAKVAVFSCVRADGLLALLGRCEGFGFAVVEAPTGRALGDTLTQAAIYACCDKLVHDLGFGQADRRQYAR